MPFLFAKKEVFQWLKDGKKTIDIRKGSPKSGELAVFQSGPSSLKFRVVKVVSGRLSEVLLEDNYRWIIPSAGCLAEAFAYFERLYGDCGGIFTAYYLGAV
ncbi:MAG: hypothetical protein NWE92_01065 [Candidatus Bathyarchaeota archaeon]|nr:hypothetical protein [Candidatus Bathyarchaeota archaeon]